ncbi:hypothetical protein PTSG_04699 [Salpingoeca rosetta]|uniref:Uncharacterized protein n=1 Tax=Salpingoeca rosetta (strain ATCC 50818 / BSB-021) TaxID=946362 RepID=F2U9G4_SALR5|nr:uncharacterized protein PTSG_04699 [Salpingoeca rosetta]EGD72991.1 hypothetical protein PTSG_04699 [Salpingoeca rosetta]|eukprot:XP_004994022.1 hypothetical protein PTSG_04699 [Salpingoeca rosetta]
MLRRPQQQQQQQQRGGSGKKPNKKDAEEVIALQLKSSELASHRLDHQHALDEAQQAMDLAESVHADDSMDLIAPYVQLGSAYLGVGQTKNAEKYLTQAHWLALKASEPLPAVLEAKMHRSLGRLYLAKEKLAESLAHFAEDVYFSSCAFGPMDPQCCTGYFHMAILFETHDEQRCKAFRTLVARIWRAYLFRVFLSTEREGDDDADNNNSDNSDKGGRSSPDVQLDPVLEAECERHLQFLFSLHCAEDALDEIGANVCLATLLLVFVRGDASSLNVKDMLARVLRSSVPRTDDVKVQARQLRDRMHTALNPVAE